MASSKKTAALKFVVFLLFTSNNGYTESSSYEDQPYRTAFHFQPPKNWMNEPPLLTLT